MTKSPSKTRQIQTLIPSNHRTPHMDKFRDAVLKFAHRKLDCNGGLSAEKENLIERGVLHFFKSFRTPDHPPYGAMIHRAIQELSEKRGSTEESISNYIRKEYKDLPWAHSTLLKRHLGKLCSSAEIFVTREKCYLLGGAGHSVSRSRPKKKRKKKNKKLKSVGELSLVITAEDNITKPNMDNVETEQNPPQEGRPDAGKEEYKDKLHEDLNSKELRQTEAAQDQHQNLLEVKKQLYSNGMGLIKYHRRRRQHKDGEEQLGHGGQCYETSEEQGQFEEDPKKFKETSTSKFFQGTQMQRMRPKRIKSHPKLTDTRDALVMFPGGILPESQERAMVPSSDCPIRSQGPTLELGITGLELAAVEQQSFNERERRQQRRWSQKLHQGDPNTPIVELSPCLPLRKLVPEVESTEVSGQRKKLRSWEKGNIPQSETVTDSIFEPPALLGMNPHELSEISSSVMESTQVSGKGEELRRLEQNEQDELLEFPFLENSLEGKLNTVELLTKSKQQAIEISGGTELTEYVERAMLASPDFPVMSESPSRGLECITGLELVSVEQISPIEQEKGEQRSLSQTLPQAPPNTSIPELSSSVPLLKLAPGVQIAQVTGQRAKLRSWARQNVSESEAVRDTTVQPLMLLEMDSHVPSQIPSPFDKSTRLSGQREKLRSWQKRSTSESEIATDTLVKPLALLGIESTHLSSTESQLEEFSQPPDSRSSFLPSEQKLATVTEVSPPHHQKKLLVVKRGRGRPPKYKANEPTHFSSPRGLLEEFSHYPCKNSKVLLSGDELGTVATGPEVSLPEGQQEEQKQQVVQRGRGRPPKSKANEPTQFSSPDSPLEAFSLLPRKRLRVLLSKRELVTVAIVPELSLPQDQQEEMKQQAVRRGRGRPPKPKSNEATNFSDPESVLEEFSQSSIKRSRVLPSEHKLVTVATMNEEENIMCHERRGRPCKFENVDASSSSVEKKSPPKLSTLDGSSSSIVSKEIPRQMGNPNQQVKSRGRGRPRKIVEEN